MSIRAYSKLADSFARKIESLSGWHIARGMGHVASVTGQNGGPWPDGVAILIGASEG